MHHLDVVGPTKSNPGFIDKRLPALCFHASCLELLTSLCRGASSSTPLPPSLLTCVASEQREQRTLRRRS
ncbi:hypothetical protein PBY51_025014 [Eleginops maclovinus]|uniref:Uncharacterized protein n=1 Tax=Eleginops maclovinus TaxID=56733 RepID=A0AAN8AS86_ELEMC|nr:hypothetical protein PBY51_025014 [Eleginops maclovinus]